MSDNMEQRNNNGHMNNSERSNDHDLLIEIKTKLSSVIDEMRLMRDDTKEKVKTLEVNKVEVKDFNEYKVNITQSMNEIRLNYTNSINNLYSSIKSLQDETKALLLKNSFIWGAFSIIAFAAPYIIRSFSK